MRLEDEPTIQDELPPAISCATGTVLMLGIAEDTFRALCANPLVTRLLVVSPDIRTPRHRRGEGWLEMIRVSPFSLKRRDAPGPIDYLWGDLWEDPWDHERIETMHAFARKFRPLKVGYRHQELDIAAQWVAAGNSLDAMTSASAIDIFRLGTSLMVYPREDAYVVQCRQIATAYIDAARARRSRR